MSDDIVTRLREHSLHVSVTQGVRATMLNGADEIERLRQFVESAYWNMRNVLECADDVLPSPHPLWGFLNEISETVLWGEKILDIPIPYESDHFQKRAVRGE